MERTGSMSETGRSEIMYGFEASLIEYHMTVAWWCLSCGLNG